MISAHNGTEEQDKACLDKDNLEKKNQKTIKKQIKKLKIITYNNNIRCTNFKFEYSNKVNL